MEETANSETPQLRQELDEEIYYRPIIHKLYYSSLFILLIIELIIYRLHYQEFENAGMVFGSFKFLLASSVPLGILLRLFIVVRPRIFTKFRMDINSVFLKLGKKEDEIHFSQVKELKQSFLSPIFLGGFILTLNSGKKLYFSSIIKNEHLILEGLKKYSPKLLEENKFEELIKSTKLTDHYWNHVQKKLKSIKYVSWKLLAAPLTAVSLCSSILVSNPETKSLVQWSSFSQLLLISMMINIFISVWASHYSYKKMCSSQGEFQLEKHLKWNEIIHYFGSSIVLSLLVYFLYYSKTLS